MHTLLQIDWLAHSLVVVFEGEETESELFDVASLCQLLTHQITEFVVWLVGANCVGGGVNFFDGVESVANADVLNYIA